MPVLVSAFAEDLLADELFGHLLKLDGDAYAEHGTFRRGEPVASALLAGFAVRVDAVFDVS